MKIKVSVIALLIIFAAGLFVFSKPVSSSEKQALKNLVELRSKAHLNKVCSRFLTQYNQASPLPEHKKIMQSCLKILKRKT